MKLKSVFGCCWSVGDVVPPSPSTIDEQRTNSKAVWADSDGRVRAAHIARGRDAAYKIQAKNMRRQAKALGLQKSIIPSSITVVSKDTAQTTAEPTRMSRIYRVSIFRAAEKFEEQGCKNDCLSRTDLSKENADSEREPAAEVQQIPNPSTRHDPAIMEKTFTAAIEFAERSVGLSTGLADWNFKSLAPKRNAEQGEIPGSGPAADVPDSGNNDVFKAASSKSTTKASDKSKGSERSGAKKIRSETKKKGSEENVTKKKGSDMKKKGSPRGKYANLNSSQSGTLCTTRELI